MSNYSLEIISHHPTFRNKSLRKYYVEGIDTVGAWGDEPFEIKFTNHTWQKVQVKLSVDGTDVLSGEPATTDVSKDMWVVNGYGTLSLKAWPETNNGGAQFVFTSANNSVAIHTHGDLSSRGIVAAAVFTEGHVEPIRVNPNYENHYHYHYDSYKGVLGGSLTIPTSSPIWVYNNTTTTGGNVGGTYTSNSINNCSFNASNSMGGTLSSCDASPASAGSDGRRSRGLEDTKSLEKLVAVGAGQHVDQKITYVAGLIKPTFTETIRVKYMWWDDLVSKLRQHNVPAPHASGFPGDQKRGINLGSTPRIGEYGGRAFPREATPIQSYLRV